MKHYKTFGQTNGSQYDTQPQYTPIDKVPMMDMAPQHSQFRAIRNLQHQHPDEIMQQQHSMAMQQMPPPQQQFMSPPQQQFMSPPQQHEVMAQEESLCSKVMQHIKQCQLCSGLYKHNTNTYLCIIVFLVLLILFLITKLIDK